MNKQELFAKVPSIASMLEHPEQDVISVTHYTLVDDGDGEVMVMSGDPSEGICLADIMLEGPEATATIYATVDGVKPTLEQFIDAMLAGKVMQPL